VFRLLAIDRTGAIPEPVELPAIAREAVAANVAHYNRAGFVPPWNAYVAVRDGVCVGCCAFKRAPRDGKVEIAYGTFPPNEGQGIATEMARVLVAIARAAAPSVLVTAQTLPAPNASTRILTKLGFTQVGWAEDDEVGPVWDWHLR
jgi:RimJ/RimL family protein N-acetyltransferase